MLGTLGYGCIYTGAWICNKSHIEHIVDQKYSKTQNKTSQNKKIKWNTQLSQFIKSIA